MINAIAAINFFVFIPGGKARNSNGKKNMLVATMHSRTPIPLNNFILESEAISNNVFL